MILKYFQKPKPEEMVRKWKSELQTQQRMLNRQVRNIELQETKTKRSMKGLAKRNDTKSCKLLARELVRSHKEKDRLHTSIAQLNSIVMDLQRQLATLKMVGHLQQSAEVMKKVNTLVKVPQIATAVQELSREMMKAGIIGDMVEDSLDVMDDEEVESEAEDEVNKILFEVTDGLLGQAKTVSTPPKPEKAVEVAKPSPVAAESEDDEAELDEMQARLAALRA
ncbi:Vacuolar protein-sorting-associated protein 24 [Dispira parvispora]|uniref:Vacuolar protein-sorting-associated protein 24 n=1 Tax=Dispira parvispora TaxID=1520584 RepID=A0A9W8AVS8_9FUNG|nr:Vacuolar protein-sorting-associated protein 24 [Dispira parvispora]